MTDLESRALKFVRCTNCVMDTSDSRISFDEDGVCDHCRDFWENVEPGWDTGAGGRAELERMAERIRKDGEGRDFDCILGMSGGLDSTYLLHVAVVEMGLRPLVFHVDGGWNTQIAVQNIERIVDRLGLDLYTEVINWEEMRDFQLAFFKAGVPHLDIPQDQAFISALYNFCLEHKIRYIVNGGNISTECVRNPLEWIYYGTDMVHLRDIRRQFATLKLDSFPISGVFRHKVWLRYVKRVQVVKPLNHLPYIRKDAIELLRDKYDFEYYGQKHFESRFTRFYEGYWLPTKFGYDTRKVQFSSLILTGQMTREEALEELEGPAYDPETIEHDFEFVATKLGITTDELRAFHEAPNKSYRDYRTTEPLFNFGARVMKRLGLERSIKR
ncbi:MAG: N-acetyl sugar amidotransferase [Actinomycetota bacterium]